MKRIAAFFITALVIIMFQATADAAETNKRTVQLVIGANQAQVNGNSVALSSPAQLLNGTTLVPLRFVGEAFGCDVQWKAISNSAVVKLVDQNIEVPVGVSYAYVNGNRVGVQVPAQLIDGSTYVPLRFISENLGAQVDYNSSTRTVLITLQTYIDKERGFEMILPAGWVFDKAEDMVVMFSFNNTCQFGVGIAIEQAFDQQQFKRTTERCIEKMKDAGREVISTNTSDTVVEITCRVQGHIVITYYILRDSRIYLVEAAVPEKLGNTDIFEQSRYSIMINTLHKS